MKPAEGIKTRIAKVGGVMIGGDWPVSIQTMWKFPLAAIDDASIAGVIARITSLADIGCDILRFAVPDIQSAEALGLLSERTPMPLVADIHFDWKIAMRCLDYPIAKIRLNPGNIGARWKVEEVVAKAREKGVSIRIGVNAGSLPEDLRDKSDRAAAVVEAAEREIAVFEDLDFDNVIVSMKVSDVAETIAVNRLFAARYRHPLHIGVTRGRAAHRGCRSKYGSTGAPP